MKFGFSTYKQKMLLLKAGAIILLVLCYRYGIKKTWDVYGEYKEYKLKTTELGDYASLLPSIQFEEKRVNEVIKKNSTDTLNGPIATLAFIASFCKENNIKMTEYMPMQINANNYFNIGTRQISLQGDYIDLLSLIYEMENHTSYGKISSVVFKKTEDPSTAKTILNCTFYLQNLIRSSNEKY